MNGILKENGARNCVSLFCAAMMAVAAQGAEPSAAEAAAKGARAAFERANNEFRGRTAYIAEALGAEDRYETAKGKATWFFLAPYSRDSRVRFVRAVFEDGRFLRGDERLLGFENKPIDVNRFEKLRDDFPMGAVNTDATGESAKIAALYPPRKSYSGKMQYTGGFGFNPCADAVGALGDSLKRFGLKNGVAFDVTFRSGDGKISFVYPHVVKDVYEKEFLPPLKEAWVKVDASKKDAISDRMLADLCRTATLERKGVR